MFFHCRSSIIRFVTAQFQCSNRHLIIRQISAANLQRISKEEREYNIPVPWGHIAVKEWGPKTGKPVLCLHGWMDHVDSFGPLIALLSSGHRFISFDFSGHGLSSWRPLGSLYGSVELFTDVVRVVEHLKLDRFHVMGHSIGSCLCLWYATLCPENVGKVICIDAVNTPPAITANPEKVAKAILLGLEWEKIREKPPRSLSRQEAIDVMVKSGKTKVAAEIMLGRSSRLSKDGSGFVWNRDPRLYAIITLALGNHLTNYISKECKKDLLLFLVTNSMYKNAQDPDGSYREAFAKHCSSYKFVEVEGNHYSHIENPQLFAPSINEFLAQNEMIIH